MANASRLLATSTLMRDVHARAIPAHCKGRRCYPATQRNRLDPHPFDAPPIRPKVAARVYFGETGSASQSEGCELDRPTETARITPHKYYVLKTKKNEWKSGYLMREIHFRKYTS